MAHTPPTLTVSHSRPSGRACHSASRAQWLRESTVLKSCVGLVRPLRRGSPGAGPAGGDGAGRGGVPARPGCGKGGCAEPALVACRRGGEAVRQRGRGVPKRAVWNCATQWVGCTSTRHLAPRARRRGCSPFLGFLGLLSLPAGTAGVCCWACSGCSAAARCRSAGCACARPLRSALTSLKMAVRAALTLCAFAEENRPKRYLEAGCLGQRGWMGERANQEGAHAARKRAAEPPHRHVPWLE